jgi:SAM-dependent methyltransferase
MLDWWKYDNLESGAPYDWSPAGRGDHEYDGLDFHLDLGAGTLPKGRLGIDRHPAPGVGLVIDLNTMTPLEDRATQDLYEEAVLQGHLPGLAGLPFPNDSIESIVSHHCLEHIGEGFVALMDECHRILKPGGIFRIIVPLFPSKAAVEDPDHKRYFMEETFETFCGAPDGKHWHESFSVPYTSCRFELIHKDMTAGVKPRDSWGDPEVEGIEPDEQWGPKDVREIRVALRKWPVQVEEEMKDEDQVHEGRGDAGGDELAVGSGTPESGRDRQLAGVA